MSRLMQGESLPGSDREYSSAGCGEVSLPDLAGVTRRDSGSIFIQEVDMRLDEAFILERKIFALLAAHTLYSDVTMAALQVQCKGNP